MPRIAVRCNKDIQMIFEINVLIEAFFGMKTDILSIGRKKFMLTAELTNGVLS